MEKYLKPEAVTEEITRIFKVGMLREERGENQGERGRKVVKVLPEKERKRKLGRKTREKKTREREKKRKSGGERRGLEKG